MKEKAGKGRKRQEMSEVKVKHHQSVRERTRGSIQDI